MLISELIKELQEALAERGDLPVSFVGHYASEEFPKNESVVLPPLSKEALEYERNIGLSGENRVRLWTGINTG